VVVQAVAYMGTSSATNSGPDKDSEKRQRAAIEAFAAARGFELIDWFYDAAVSGADPVHERPGFTAMLDRIAGNGVRCVIVESPDRFARDLAVQLAGHDFLKKLGVALIPASAPDFFTEECSGVAACCEPAAAGESAPDRRIVYCVRRGLGG
jgi:DNA invertase Pin-like site-specific DNA recombinase